MYKSRCSLSFAAALWSVTHVADIQTKGCQRDRCLCWQCMSGDLRQPGEYAKGAELCACKRPKHGVGEPGQHGAAKPWRLPPAACCQAGCPHPSKALPAHHLHRTPASPHGWASHWFPLPALDCSTCMISCLWAWALTKLSKHAGACAVLLADSVLMLSGIHKVLRLRVVAPTQDRSMAGAPSSIPAHYPTTSSASTVASSRMTQTEGQQIPPVEWQPQNPAMLQVASIRLRMMHLHKF